MGLFDFAKDAGKKLFGHEAEAGELCMIQKGDTLSAIAKQLYGDANAYPRLFEANREVIKDASLIFPGQKIRIPR